MTGKVFVDSRDEYLILRLRVLCRRAGLLLCESGKCEDAVLTVRDADLPLSQAMDDSSVPVLTLSRNPSAAADAYLPIENEKLIRLLRGESMGARLTLCAKEKYAHLDGRRIRLTEIESALLSLLIEANGEFVAHESAVHHVWSGDASAGAVNVYIHYLREKLETKGERIILAKRGKGYAIDKKFLGGESEC